MSNAESSGRPVVATHAILVGLPGAGKSTVGRMLAERFNCDFVDLDEEIERLAGLTIPRIFEAMGEAGFRELERLATERIALRDQLILAPGGGWITQAATVSLLRPPGKMIFLRIGAGLALDRVRSSGVPRPLLQDGHPERRIEALLRERQPLYEHADLAVDAELSVQQVVSRCERWLASTGWQV